VNLSLRFAEQYSKGTSWWIGLSLAQEGDMAEVSTSAVAEGAFEGRWWIQHLLPVVAVRR
jgi:hypothetical protein